MRFQEIRRPVVGLGLALAVSVASVAWAQPQAAPRQEEQRAPGTMGPGMMRGAPMMGGMPMMPMMGNMDQMMQLCLQMMGQAAPSPQPGK